MLHAVLRGQRLFGGGPSDRPGRRLRNHVDFAAAIAMPRQSQNTATDPLADPFHELPGTTGQRRLSLLGARVLFESAHPALLRLVDHAYRGLPGHRARSAGPALRIQLRLTRRQVARARRRPPPPPLKTLSGPGGLLCGVMDESNFVLLSPAARAGLIAVSHDMLSRRYHARYELIEFALFTLAARSLGLVPLHAACIGRAGRGLLLIGDSGAGKSTLALHCALQGTEFLSEDAVFVDPKTLLASGISNFVHIREDSLHLIESDTTAARISRSPVIHRRSGAAKFEVDMRGLGCRLARAPLRLAGIVFLSARRAGSVATLRPLSPQRTLARLTSAQAYAAGRPEWQAFRRRLAGIEGYELQRGSHPSESAIALRHLLERQRSG
jgi:hypothetical protein